jgi:WD40 repeat protein
LQSETLIKKLKRPVPGAIPRVIEFSPDEKKLAICDSTTNLLHLYETQTWSLLESIDCDLDEIVGMKFSPDGSKLIIHSWKGNVSIVDMDKMEKIQGESEALCAATSWDDNSSEIILDGHGNLRQVKSEEIIQNVSFRWKSFQIVEAMRSGSKTKKSDAKMNQLGDILVYWDLTEGMLFIHDPKKNKSLGVIPIIFNYLNGLELLIAISKSGEYLAIGNDNGQVFIWDLEEWRKQLH